MSDDQSISDGQLGRIQGDLAIMQRAIGLHLYFGSGILIFSILLSVAALIAALLSLISDSSWLQVVPFTVLMVLCLFGLFIQSHRFAELSHEIKLQVILSITVYFAVICAACGYVLAAFCGPSIGTARTIALYAASLAYILTLMFILVLNALKTRERYYCLGLAISLILSGLLIPIFDPHYSFPLAHCIMSIGYLAVVVIQRLQLREALPQDVTD